MVDDENDETQPFGWIWDNYLNSEFTQMIDNHISFKKDNILIETDGFFLEGHHFHFKNKDAVIFEQLIGKGNSARV